jgi:histidinol phosphatase-like enzyme
VYDGNIIEDRNYLADAQRLSLLPSAAGGLWLLASSGFRLAVVTSGVGSGPVTPAEPSQVQARLKEVLSAEGGDAGRDLQLCPSGRRRMRLPHARAGRVGSG